MGVFVGSVVRSVFEVVLIPSVWGCVFGSEGSLLGVKGVMWSLLGVKGVGSVVTHHTPQRRITPTPQMPVQTNTS